MAKRKIKRIVKISKKKKRHPIRNAILFLLLILISVGSFIIYDYSKKVLSNLDSIQRIDLGETDQQLMINDGVRTNHNESGVINIALFGMDARAGQEDDGNRSDTIILLSINEKSGAIKLTSILRDTYIKIPGEYYTRINAAYSLGGPKLAVQTINRNFDMDIENFVSVDFNAIADIVDVLGGLTLTVTTDEVTEMNACIDENNMLSTSSPSPHVKAGTQLCDGKQVLGYARMRYLGNGDFDRTARQREVLGLIYSQFKSKISPELILDLSSALSKDIVTSLSTKEMFELGYKIMKIKEIPAVTALTDPEILKGATIDDSMILLPYTLSDATIYLHNFIYDINNYKPTADLKEYSSDLYERTYDEDIYTIDTGVTAN